ncbi:MAG: hypothetical protein AAFN07_12040 [Pseudomonadota bacterium]
MARELALRAYLLFLSSKAKAAQIADDPDNHICHFLAYLVIYHALIAMMLWAAFSVTPGHRGSGLSGSATVALLILFLSVYSLCERFFVNQVKRYGGVEKIRQDYLDNLKGGKERSNLGTLAILLGFPALGVIIFIARMFWLSRSSAPL